METVIGIDLGTSTTEAAVYRNGDVEMIPNSDGSYVIPSAVGLDEEGNLIVGEKAKSRYILHPDLTAIEIKRNMGTTETIRLGNKSYTAAELSAEILKVVRQNASEYLGEEVKRAVISVPAYFDDLQRRDVVKAGQLAGFVVERIINEPTAAAMSYGINHLEEESYILIYDLGGGTFDVTLLEMFDGVLEVKASSGDNRLGGKDFDACLIRFLKERFEEKNGVSLDGDVFAEARLKEQAEACKISLGTKEEVRVRIPMLTDKGGLPLGLEETVTREQFENLIEEYVKRTHEPIRTALEDGGVSAGELSMVLLAGGSTRVPLVVRDLAGFLGQEPKKEINPDFSVAEGAAIQAGIISGAVAEEDSLVMTDVNPYTLGVRCLTEFSPDFMSVIIPRNTTIPVTRYQTYYTSYDGQQAARVEVYQGESRRASRNHLLGSFLLEGIPSAPAGKESLKISFSYDLNGMLRVEARIASTGKAADISVNMMEATEDARIDVSEWRKAEGAGDYRSVVRRAEKLQRSWESSPDEEEQALAGELEELLYLLKKAVLEGDFTQADSYEDELEDLMEMEG